MSSSSRFAAVLLGTVLLAGAARADNPKINADFFRPSVHPGDILGIQTATQPKSLDWGAGAWFTFNAKTLRLVGDSSGQDYQILSQQLITDIYGHIGLFDFLDIGLDIPVALMSKGDAPSAGSSLTKVGGAALGDLRLGLKGTFLGGNGKGFGLALAEDLTFPTATKAVFIGDRTVTGTTNVILDYSGRGWQAALNLGFRLKGAVQVEGREFGHQLLIGGGVSAPLVCGVLDLIGTAEMRTALTDPFGSSFDNGLDLMGGLRFHWKGFQLIAAGGGGVLEGYGTPAYNATVNLGYAPTLERGCKKDTDGDGLCDPEDACPNEAGLPALGGCPDRDGDGVADRDDRCPDKAGARELKGCPDRDKDGIPDVDDQCPDKPGFAQFNGCPDTDKDGIPDPKDACPDQPGKAALNGCPDRDGDGIADKDDACPDQYGKAEFKGCPPPTPKKIKLTEKKIEILEQVHFDTAKATIKADSFELLNDVATVLKDNPQITKIRVEGHTDNVGNKKKNLKLSQDRAKSVMDHLVQKGGVAADRLVSEGFGDTQPVADNKTKEGKALNRRVEFVIVQVTTRTAE
jgi:outer membrane protein OmpA-like peptidoglycan-associated protein